MRSLLTALLAVVFFFSCAQAQDLKVEKEVSRDHWEVGLPLGACLQPLGDHLVISNRAALISKSEWKPGKLSFEWKPINLPFSSKDEKVHTDENIRLYGDHLAVVLSTTGKMKKMPDGRGGEIDDGIVVKIDAGGGNVWLTVGNTTVHKKLIREEGKPALAEQFHKVQVTDTGTKVSVSVNGLGIAEIEVPKEARKGKFLALYNREPVGPGESKEGTPPGSHISHLKNLKNEVLK